MFSENIIKQTNAVKHFLNSKVYIWQLKMESFLILRKYNYIITIIIWCKYGCSLEMEAKMEKLNTESKKLMVERFGQDTIIALATMEGEMPNVRYVNGYYEDGAFYVITYGLSNKMRQIEKNPNVAIAGDWFTAHGKGINLGYFGKDENAEIASKLREAFVQWIDNGHNNFSDVNTCILCIRLTDGILFSHGTRYDIDFSEQ